MEYTLAVDIGASSGRHIVSHVEGDKLITEEIYRFENAPTVTEEGGVRTLHWDIERLFAEIVNGLAKAKELGKVPSSVGIDTWGVDYVLLDRENQPIGGAYCYRDARTEKSVPEVHAIVPFAELYRRTGIMFNTFNTVYQLYADKMSGRIEKAVNFLMLPDYFQYRLTGKMAHEYTNATTTGLVNAKTHTWDGEILGKLGIPVALLGELTAPATKLGAFSDEIAAKVGYKADVILPCTHDTASAVVAAPVFGDAPYISSGTWSLLGVERDEAETSDFAMESGYSNEGCLGYRFRLQKNIMGLWMIQQVRHELNDAYSFAELADLARKNPVPDRVQVNDQRFLSPVSMTEEIYAAVGRKLTVGEIAYVIYASLAESYKESLEALETLTGKKFTTLNIIGGGSKNGLLNEMTKKATGKTVITGPAEGTAIGNLIIQLIGKGELASVEEGRRMIVRSFDIAEV